MANLHFKDCSETFNVFVQKSKNLKIGLSAYKSYVDKQLLEFTKVIRSIYDNQSRTRNESDHHLSDLVPITIERDGVNRIASVTLGDLVQLASGEVQDVSVGFCKPDTNIIEPSTTISLEELNQFVTDKISCLQGQSVVFGAAIKQDINSSFDIQQLFSEMTLRGFETSDYLQSLVAGVTSGMTWADILSLLAGSIKEPEVDENGYWYFDVEDFTNTNSLVLGLTSIVNSVTGFFSNIKFDIRKIGDFFKNLWKGITDLVTWILTIIAGDLFTDYIVKKDYTLEGFNIPIASVKCDLTQLTSKSELNNLVAECANYPDKKAFCRGMVTSQHNAYDGLHYGVKYVPDLIELVLHVSDDIKDGTTRVIPWSRGFMLIVRKGNELSIYYFIGDFDSPSIVSDWKISSDGEISLNKDLLFFHDYKVTEFKTNQDFKNWFESLLSPRQDGTGYTITTDSDFIGNGLEGNTSTGYEYHLDMNIDLSSISGPGSVVDQFESYYYNDVNSRFAAQLLLNGLVYNNIFTNDVVRGSLCLYDIEDNNEVYFESNFSQTNFLPYEVNQMITFKYHAQSDTERANEVLDLLKKIVIAGVAVGTAIVATHIKKSIKIKSYLTQVSANDAWRAVAQASPENRADLIGAAYKMQQQANIWSKVGALVGGKTINAAMNSNLASISLPNINDSSTEITKLLYNLVTGKMI